MRGAALGVRDARCRASSIEEGVGQVLLAGFTLLVALGAGLLGAQGALACRGRSQGLNLPVAVAAAACVVVGLVLYALMFSNPARFFGMFKHSSTGIALLLYATVIFVVVAVAYAVVSHRSEDGSVPVPLAAVAVVVALLLVAAFTLGYLQSAISKISSKYWVLLAYFLTCALSLGSFALLALGAARGDEDAVALGRKGALAGVVLACLALGGYLLWYVNSGEAQVLVQAAKNDMSSTFVVGVAAAQTPTVSVTEALATTIADNALIFWGGTVACGLALPLVAGVALLKVEGVRAQTALGLAGLVLFAAGMLCFGLLLPSLA